MHNMFMYMDEDEVETIMCARHDIKSLISRIEKNSDAEYAGHNSSGGNVMMRMHVIDLDAFRSSVRMEMNDILLDNDDDDDEYDIEYDEDNTNNDNEDTDDIDVSDYPDMDMATSTDDIDDMMENIEPVENITKNSTIEKVVPNNSTGDKSMTVPVYRR